MESWAREVKLQADEFLRELFYSPETLERPGRVVDQYKESELFNPHARPEAPSTLGGAAGSSSRFLIDAFLREPTRVAGRLQDALDTFMGSPPKETEKSSLGLGTDVALEGLGYLPFGKALLPLAMAGEIKYVHKPVAQAIRKVMKKEAKGIATATKGKGADFMRDLLRGVWWHGRTTAPEAGKTLKKARIRTDKYFGEPVGVSLSKDPEIAYRFAKFSPTKSGEAKLEISRVKPLFKGADPKDVILDAGTKEGHKVYKDAYEDTVRGIFREDKMFLEGVSDTPIIDYADFKDYLVGATKDNTAKFFNTRLTENLKDRGYKGMLWNPRRGGGEAELKIFDSDNILTVDKRNLSNVGEPYSTEELKNLMSELGDEFYVSTRKGIDFNEKGVAKWNETIGKKMRANWEDTSTEGTQSISEMLSGEVNFAELFDEVIPGYGAETTLKRRQLRDMFTDSISDSEIEKMIGL